MFAVAVAFGLEVEGSVLFVACDYAMYYGGGCGVVGSLVDDYVAVGVVGV